MIKSYLLAIFYIIASIQLLNAQASQSDDFVVFREPVLRCANARSLAETIPYITQSSVDLLPRGEAEKESDIVLAEGQQRYVTTLKDCIATLTSNDTVYVCEVEIADRKSGKSLEKTKSIYFFRKEAGKWKIDGPPRSYTDSLYKKLIDDLLQTNEPRL